MKTNILKCFPPHGSDQLVLVPDTFFDFIRLNFGVCYVLHDPSEEHSVIPVLPEKAAGSIYRLYFTSGSERYYCLFIDNKPIELSGFVTSPATV